MPFKLARHFAQHANEQQSAARESNPAVAPRSIGFDNLLGGAFAFSQLPGFARPPVDAAASGSPSQSAEQLKAQQDMLALMSGAGINVVVKNLDQQSRFG